MSDPVAGESVKFVRSLRPNQRCPAMLWVMDSQVVHFEGRTGISLCGDVAGDDAASTVLLLHGGGQTRHSWGSTQRDLVGRGFHVVSLDLRGHGDSAWAADGDYHPQAFAADVAAVAANFDSPALVGASLGGIAAMLAVHDGTADNVRGLVLVDVAPRIEVAGAGRIMTFMLEHADVGFGSLDEVADAVAAYSPQRARPTNVAGLEKNVRLRDGRWYWHWDPAFMRFGTSGSADTEALERDAAGDGGFGPHTTLLEDAAQALTLPTLLVRGRQSDLLSAEGAQRFLDLVPHAEFVDVAGAGHMVAGERNDAFTAGVVEFLERLG